jgi:glycerophosphoryl diester phosphodiesterase
LEALGYRLLLGISVLAIFTACKKNQNYENVALISHGGMGLENPNSFYHDNSIESIEMALSMNECDGVEVDLQLSADGNLWLYHDVNLESNTNKEGCIYNLKDDFLNQVKYRTLQQEKLVNLDCASKRMDRTKTIFLDIRHFSVCDEVIVPVQNVLTALSSAFNEKTGLIVITNYRPWIEPLQQEGFTVCLQVESLEEFMAVESLTFSPECYLLRNNEVTADGVQKIHHSGKKIYIFEVRSPRGIRSALNKIPDGILTDDIRAAILEKE